MGTKVKNYQDKIINGLKKRRALRLSLIFVGCFIVLIVLIFAVYSLLFQNKAYEGLRLANQNIAGKNSDTLVELMKIQNERFQTEKIDVSGADKKYQISIAEIALSYNQADTAEKAASLYHDNDLSSYWRRLVLLFQPETVVPVFAYNQEAVNEKLKVFSGDLDQPEKDYGLKIASGQVEVTTERAAGKRINQDKFKTDFQNRLISLQNLPIILLIEDKQPSVSLTNAEQAKAEAEAILAGKELTLTNQDKTYIIDVDTLSNWIIATPVDEDLVVDIDRTKLKDFLGTVAASINVGSQDASLAVVNGKVVIAGASRDGATVDIEATASKVATALLSRIHQDALLSKSLAIEVKIDKPGVTSETLATLGLTDLIGTGTTSFTTSPVNRISNITLGARLLNGALIKPGDTFSTLAKLGKIDASSGFLPELVIKENRTVPEFGGGLCQVSTTLFRAALNSGLKITERQNHHYRVSYYEPPVGMDATIYDPAPDFKFQNDTAGYILVQSHIDGKKITFDFYGTKDGRVVTLGTPSLYDVTPPPEPIMEPTDTLPAGEQKQVDHAHDGASASFTYLVTRGSDTLEKVSFVSHYVPWPARFLVGTGPVAPVPTPDPAVTATP